MMDALSFTMLVSSQTVCLGAEGSHWVDWMEVKENVGAGGVTEREGGS